MIAQEELPKYWDYWSAKAASGDGGEARKLDLRSPVG